MTPKGGDTIALIGLGLIGGSLARDFAARGMRVLAYDRDSSSVDAARGAGVVHGALDATLRGIEQADVVVIAVPVSAAREILATARQQLLHAEGLRLITDVGSTKRSIVASVESLGLGARFVGSHPMVGDHRSTWQAARRALFADARVYLCPAQSTLAASLTAAQELWRALGALPEIIDAGEHDRLVALTSHVPQVVSTALAMTLAEAGVARSGLASGGRDMTRLAGSSAEVWSAIAADNADYLASALARLESHLARLRAAMATPNEHDLHTLFAQAAEWFADKRGA
ncbi:MAG: prephenate dehydrogenase [Gemmatimonadaceae bacterium]